MVNILAGGVKSRLAALGYNFELSIPTVIKGNTPMDIAKLKQTETVEMDVNFNDLEFKIILSVLVKKETESKFFAFEKKEDKGTQAGDELKSLIGG